MYVWNAGRNYCYLSFRSPSSGLLCVPGKWNGRVSKVGEIWCPRKWCWVECLVTGWFQKWGILCTILKWLMIHNLCKYVISESKGDRKLAYIRQSCFVLCGMCQAAELSAGVMSLISSVYISIHFISRLHTSPLIWPLGRTRRYFVGALKITMDNRTKQDMMYVEKLFGWIYYSNFYYLTERLIWFYGLFLTLLYMTFYLCKIN